MKENIIKEAKNKNIDINRVKFLDYVNLEDHLSRHSVADLFLDTFNYNAGSTAVIALLSGLPILTLYGKSYHSRMSSSLLKSIDMDELIAHNKNEYQEKAFFFATNPVELEKIREKLKFKLNDHKSFNTNLFTKELELKYKLIYSKQF